MNQLRRGGTLRENEVSMSMGQSNEIRRFMPLCLVMLGAVAMLFGCASKAGGKNAGKQPVFLPVAVEPAPPPPPVEFTPLDSDLQRRALAELDALTRSPMPYVRAHSLEVMQDINEPDREIFISRGLDDQEAVVRFAAAMAAGRVKLLSSRDRLLEMIQDPDPNVRIAVRYALHKMGITKYSHDLEKTAVDKQASIRGNTVLVLGLLGEPSGVKILSAMTRDPNRVVRLQVAEALWRLGDEHGLQLLVAASINTSPDEQIIANLAMAAPGDPAVIPHIKPGLQAYQEEVQLSAARALGMLGSDAGYVAAQQNVASRDPRRRGMAALAFGAIGRLDSQKYLAQLLRDNDPDVRVAACSAILSLKPN